MVPMVPGREDLDHVLVGEVGAVPDGLHPGYSLSSIQECGRPGPTSELEPLHGPRMPPQLPPEGIHRVPQEAHTYPPLAPDHPNEGGWTLRGPTEVYPQT